MQEGAEHREASPGEVVAGGCTRPLGPPLRGFHQVCSFLLWPWLQPLIRPLFHPSHATHSFSVASRVTFLKHKYIHCRMDLLTYGFGIFWAATDEEICELTQASEMYVETCLHIDGQL